MKTVIFLLCMILGSSFAHAEEFAAFAEEFFAASETLDKEYLAGKQDCQRRYSFKGAPERDSAKYQRCVEEWDEQFLKKRCAFFVMWYKRSKNAGGPVRPENYPRCVNYKY